MFKFFIPALFLMGSTTCQLLAPQALVSSGLSSQYRSQDNIGNYAFGYNEDGLTGGTFRREQGNAAGQVVGSYGLRTADGRLRTVNYVADDAGFRAAINTNEPGVEPKDPAAVTINKPALVQQLVAAAPAPIVAAAAPAPIVAAAAPAPIAAAPAPIISSAPLISSAASPIWQSSPLYNPTIVRAAPIVQTIPSSAPLITSATYTTAGSPAILSSPYTISNVAVAPATWGYTLGLPPTFGYTIRKK